MDKLRKLWQWVWRNKERMVLGILVIVLGYQVYQVVSFSADVQGPPPKSLTNEPPKNPDWYAKAFVEPPSRNDYSSLYVRNPFWVYSSTGESKEDAKQGGGNALKLLDIQPAPGGKNSALIKTQDAKWYAEGEEFESYKLLKVDPARKTAVVWSSKLNRNVTLKVSTE